jgi:hypothetical protein
MLDHGTRQHDVEPPDVTVPLARLEEALASLPVTFDYLDLRRIRDLILSPSVYREIACPVMRQDRGVDEEDPVLQNYGISLILFQRGQRFGIDNHRFVILFVPFVIVEHDQQFSERGVGDKGRPDPVVDQAARRTLGSASDKRDNQDLAAPEACASVRRFITPQERPLVLQALSHAGVCVLNIILPCLQGAGLRLDCAQPCGNNRPEQSEAEGCLCGLPHEFPSTPCHRLRECRFCRPE